MKNPRYICLPTLCLSLCLIGATIRAEIIELKDDFDIQGKSASSLLQRQAVGNSQIVWDATSNISYSEASGLVIKDQEAFMARVAVPAAVTETIVEADLRPVQPGAKAGWVAVGMGKSSLGNPTFGGLYLLVFPKGDYALLFNPDENDARSSKVVTLKRGRISTFDMESTTRLKLSYHASGMSVSAWINEDPILEAFDLKDKGLKLNPAYVGFSGYGQAPNIKTVTRFSATFTK